jgi:hypothetical protein
MKIKKIVTRLPKKDLSEFKDLLIFFNPNFVAKSFKIIGNEETRLQRVIKRNPLVGDLIRKLDMFEID